MKPAAFDYHAPDSLEETLALLARHGDDARILAGGQSLVPLMNMRMVQPEVLISLHRCAELDYLRAEDGRLACGAMARQWVVEESNMVRDAGPLLAEALPLVGGRASRNRGTVCGSMAHADPLSELPAVALALDAEFAINGVQGRRSVAAADFFVSEMTTCIAPGEMLEAVYFPCAPVGARAAFVETGNRAHGFALVGVAAQLEVNADGNCTRARLAALGVGATAVRLSAAEEVLNGQPLDGGAPRDAGAAAAESVAPVGNLHADADYRRHLLAELVERAVRAAQ